jgi:hypothetical protein
MSSQLPTGTFLRSKITIKSCTKVNPSDTPNPCIRSYLRGKGAFIAVERVNPRSQNLPTCPSRVLAASFTVFLIERQEVMGE